MSLDEERVMRTLEGRGWVKESIIEDEYDREVLFKMAWHGLVEVLVDDDINAERMYRATINTMLL
jgi:hypothetical protein